MSSAVRWVWGTLKITGYMLHNILIILFKDLFFEKAVH